MGSIVKAIPELFFDGARPLENDHRLIILRQTVYSFVPEFQEKKNILRLHVWTRLIAIFQL